MEAKEIERLIACAELRNPEQHNASRERYIIEISFKAGYERGYQQGFSDGIGEGKAEGRQEVVEWVEKNAEGWGQVNDGAVIIDELDIPLRKWQAQIKKWEV